MIRLTEDKVAVAPIFDPDTSPGGIIIPDMAKERCDQGIVKYIGPDVKDIKIGMYVIYSGYTGTLVRIQGEGDLIIMPEKFIVAEIPEVENVFVPGLFFRQRVPKVVAENELVTLLHDAFLTYPTTDPRSVAEKLAEILVSKGVTGPSANSYFEADYEHVIEYLSKAFQESSWYRGINIKMQKPKYNANNELEPV